MDNNSLKNTGIRISEYPYGPTNNDSHKGKLILDHSFITWAPSHYGISTINKNYQIDINTLRKDFAGYIGVNNSKARYRNYVNLWYGDWFNKDITKSYVFQWTSAMCNHDDYIYNKHGLDVEFDKEHMIDRIFVLTDAPLPLQQTFEQVNPIDTKNHGVDPNPISSKLVTKKYIDDRHAGIRKVQITGQESVNKIKDGSTLQIRPYTCFYQYDNTPVQDLDGIYTINITSTAVLQDGRTMFDVLRHNRLMFYIRLTNRPQYYYTFDNNGNKIHTNNLKILVDGKDQVMWSYENELSQILRQSRPKMDDAGVQQNVNKNYIFIRCEAEYIRQTNDQGEAVDKFVVTCSNFFGRGKNNKRIVQANFDTSNNIYQIDLKLSMHQNESFLTQIPQQSIPDGETTLLSQYYIKLDASDLDDYHEYTWNYYIITPAKASAFDNRDKKNYDDVIFETGATPIMWAMEQGYNIAPRLQPNKLYCFQFVKVFDKIIIGRIKYFVNLVKKS